MIVIIISFTHLHPFFDFNLQTDNILVRIKALHGIGSVHLADLGVAKVCEGNTVASTIAGTVDWIAPEVANHRPNQPIKYNPLKSDSKCFFFPFFFFLFCQKFSLSSKRLVFENLFLFFFSKCGS